MRPNEDILLELFGYQPSRGDQKKLQIVKAVVEILAHEGVANLTFEAVGKRIKVGKANVRYHFKSTEELIMGAIKFVTFTAQQITVEKVGQATTPLARVEAIVVGAFDWFKRYPSHIPVWGLFCYYSTINPNFSELHSVIRSTGQKRLEALLKPLVEVKAHESTALAGLIQALISGALLDLAISRRGKDLTDIQRRILGVVHQLIRN